MVRQDAQPKSCSLSRVTFVGGQCLRAAVTHCVEQRLWTGLLIATFYYGLATQLAAEPANVCDNQPLTRRGIDLLDVSQTCNISPHRQVFTATRWPLVYVFRSDFRPLFVAVGTA